jgi:hypothetical protein
MSKSNLDRLTAIGFEPVGHWLDGVEWTLHKGPGLKHVPGLYAFVVEGRASYIGRTVSLNTRLRNYKNRCIGKAFAKRHRASHSGILATLAAGSPVHVYVWRVPRERLKSEETILIAELSPDWNR